MPNIVEASRSDLACGWTKIGASEAIAETKSLSCWNGHFNGSGDPKGAVNYYLLWDTRDIVDEPNRWEMTVFLTANAPQDTCAVDLTPRRLQKFRPRAGDRFQWANHSLNDGAPVQFGETLADLHETATFRVLYVFLVLAHERRKILPFNITEAPSAGSDGTLIWEGPAHGFLVRRSAHYPSGKVSLRAARP